MTTPEKLEELINAGERDDRCSGSFADELRVITAGMKVAQSAEAAEARVAELTRERDALDANRNRLIAVINSNLNERDEARAQVTALTAENAVLREAIKEHSDEIS
jgi:predicted transcriptional regulator